MVKKILYIEGAAVFIASLYFYHQTGGNWIMFALLILLPDLSILGYLKNKKIGAFIYNLIHNYILAPLIILIGLYIDQILLVHLGLILTSHVGMDRMLGLGLKYSNKFKNTHLQNV
ncbi:MAG TPA: DUF4260 domain-containing protein [Patescibacteria group bacterium]|nr:DUF4260 domain-containing protein [Patescibacteria group bacterium]